jgi:Domain of unknown function (DUF4279)
MQHYSFVINLRIWHPNIDPALITAKLGLKPIVQHHAGLPRTTPKGRALGGTYSESHWNADPFEHGEYKSTEESVEDVLMSVVELLAPHKAFLHLLKSQGARLHLQVSTHSNKNYALVFDPELLAGCASIGLCLVHDTYPYPQNW